MELEIKNFNGICDYCRKYGKKASEDTNYKGIILLCPDELWICEDCLKRKSGNIIIGADA